MARSIQDVNKSYNEFVRIFMQNMNKCCPYIKMKIGNRNNNDSKPWFTHGLKNACCKKNALFRTFLKSKSTEDESRYKLYENRLTTILRNCEK